MQKTIIDAQKSNFDLDLKELFRYKDLFFTLALRDFKVRYAQMALGFIWVILQPLVTLLVLYVVFSKGLSVQTGNIPYGVFAMAGMSLWTYFSYVISNAGASIISSQALISKIYFPRLIIPISKAMVGLIDLGIAMLILLAFFLYYGLHFQFQLLYVPFIFLWVFFGALGIGILFSALSVRFRDFQYIIPFVVQIGFYFSPIAYNANIVKGKFEMLYYLNPMAGAIEMFRYCLFQHQQLSPYYWISIIVSILLFLIGVVTFKYTESKMADLV